jgi:hypothetical protein
VAGFKVGSTDVSTVKIGSTQVEKIYVGSNAVWENATYVPLSVTVYGSSGFNQTGRGGVTTVNFQAREGMTHYFRWMQNDTGNYPGGCAGNIFWSSSSGSDSSAVCLAIAGGAGGPSNGFTGITGYGNGGGGTSGGTKGRNTASGATNEGQGGNGGSGGYWNGTSLVGGSGGSAGASRYNPVAGGGSIANNGRAPIWSDFGGQGGGGYGQASGPALGGGNNSQYDGWGGGGGGGFGGGGAGGSDGSYGGTGGGGGAFAHQADIGDSLLYVSTSGGTGTSSVTVNNRIGIVIVANGTTYYSSTLVTSSGSTSVAL